jgi:uncharacterized Ntn-hydrolase superfamily protein
MTFSLIARCVTTGRFGMVISSSSPAVAARCSHVRAGIGAVASQNITDPELGPSTLDALEKGHSAAEAVQKILQTNPFKSYRQVLAVDNTGQTFIHSGREVLGIWNELAADNCAAAGNLLANDGIPAAMVERFKSTQGELGDRLMAALASGLAAGGEAGPVRSAGLKIADKLTWPYVDLRVDWSDRPIEDLALAWAVYKPQADAYVDRAMRPGAAPSFGVAGDR